MRIQVSDPSSTPQILFLRSGITPFPEKKEGELNEAGVVSTDAVQAVLTTWNDSKEGGCSRPRSCHG
jgi:hypothetical protein